MILIYQNYRLDIFFAGAFFITYLVCLFSVGVPLFLLELSLGQFTGGAIGYWMICPLFQGIEIICFWINLFSTYYYILILAWALLYLTHMFQRNIPWQKCHKPWATPCKFHSKNILVQ